MKTEKPEGLKSSSKNQPLIVGHRGLSAAYPENTLISFRKAIEAGVDALEFDVHLTKDSELVVTHDDKIDRTSNGHGFVHDLTLAELKSLDFGSWKDKRFAGTRIPTLNETLDTILGMKPDMFVCAEIKEDDQKCARMVLEELKRRNLLRQCSMISFFANILQFLKRSEPALLVHGFIEGVALNFTSETYSILDRVGIWRNTLTPELVKFFRDRKIYVDTWAADNEEQLDQVMALEVDGITSNAPDIIIGILKKRGIRQ